ncbi:MAG: hypothetical protein QM783_17320 [Phycisphaerales bacterium]
MNEFERRTLLGAAGLGAIAAMSKAGPLNPPAGPVASTGRTLDDIYNKIATPPVAGAPGSPGVLSDGRILLAGGTQPLTITQSGSYVLASNVQTNDAATPAISISGGLVTLDLNGCSVANLGGPSITAAGRGSRVRNGTAAGAVGISLQQMDDSVIEDVTFLLCARSALEGAARRIAVRRCHFLSTTGLGWPGGLGGAGSSGATAVQITGDLNSVHDCTVQGTSPTNDPQGLTTYGIRLIGNGSSIAGNRVCTLPSVTGTGIRMDGTGSYRDNTVQGYSVAFGIFGGTNGGGNVAVL